MASPKEIWAEAVTGRSAKTRPAIKLRTLRFCGFACVVGWLLLLAARLLFVVFNFLLLRILRI